jgi:hypothetical protein
MESGPIPLAFIFKYTAPNGWGRPPNQHGKKFSGPGSLLRLWIFLYKKIPLTGPLGQFVTLPAKNPQKPAFSRLLPQGT